jgi:tryptophan synthase alpha chain
VDGVILTDLPPEESEKWLPEAERVGLATIFLVAPTSTYSRIQLIGSKMTSGFVYCVSRTGVTGARNDIPAELALLVAQIRIETPLPVCIGFGIATPEHVATVASIADGAVIGSALLDFLHKNAQNQSGLDELRKRVGSWKAATKRIAD